MFHGNGDWKGLPPWLRIRVYRDAIDCIRGVRAATFFSGVDLTRLADAAPAGDPPHELALRLLLQALQEYAEEADELVLTIADDINTAERHRTRLRAYRGADSDGGRPRLDRIFDTLYFGPSRHSRLLQAADLLTYMYLRRSTTTERSARAEMANRRIWRAIAPTVQSETMWPAP